jgi:adenylate cyclase
MPDLFISYSRKDSEQALALAERLRSSGIDVWIDQHGIEAAASWSKEIVRAIDDAKVFLVLLSTNSMESPNVTKEVSIACEATKKVLPVALEDIRLNDDLRYHLAGIQRVAYTQFDAITAALAGFGIAPKTVGRDARLTRKSLMVLPFEDLSPTADNQWFADGIVSELISALANVGSLRVIDASLTKEFRSYKASLATFAREMSIRYFVQGEVRKFGDNLKIMARLLDIETGDYLWQDSLKGTMQDVFDIQEQVAEKVLAGLKVALSTQEQDRLAERRTTNAEAYEYWLRAVEYFGRYTRVDYELAIEMYERAVELDPLFVPAYSGMANASQALYRSYTRDLHDLERTKHAAQKIYEIQGDSGEYCQIMALVCLRTGEFAESVKYARRAVALDPELVIAYDTLAFALTAVGDLRGAIDARKEVVTRRPDSRTARFNLVNDMRHERSIAKADVVAAALDGTEVYDRYLRLNPDDRTARTQRAYLIEAAGRTEEALKEAEDLLSVADLDTSNCYNLACVLVHAGERKMAIQTLDRAIARGFRSIETLEEDPDLEPIRAMPEFQGLLRSIA